MDVFHLRYAHEILFLSLQVVDSQYLVAIGLLSECALQTLKSTVEDRPVLELQ